MFLFIHTILKQRQESGGYTCTEVIGKTYADLEAIVFFQHPLMFTVIASKQTFLVNSGIVSPDLVFGGASKWVNKICM